MFKGIAIAAGSLGAVGAVGGGSIYGTGAFHNWMYSGQEVTFKFESSTGGRQELNLP
nr:hypothetical protein [Candidatus Mycoplasma haematolamae]